jgi:hypothetical protein
MTPTSFEFTLTMPGDARFVGAARQLTAHAAGYAQLTVEAGAELAGQVEHAAQAAVQAAGSRRTPIELRFTRDGGAVNVHIACEAAQSASPPRSSHGKAVTVDWTRTGSRHVCHIRYRTSA